MKKAYDFLKASEVFYLATVQGDQPRVRPFGAVAIFEEKLYIIMNNQKQVFAQLMENPKVEISGMAAGKWIRIAAKAVHDDRREARQAVLDQNPGLRGMYNEDDGLVEVLYLQDAQATVSSFTEPPESWAF